jgi:uncharacterized integral membrane protein
MSANVPPQPPPDPGARRQQPTRRSRWDKDALAEKLGTPKAFFGILITIAAVWFIIANNQIVRIHLWLAYVNARLWIVLLLTFVAGAIVGYLFARRRAGRREAGRRK